MTISASDLAEKLFLVTYLSLDDAEQLVARGLLLGLSAADMDQIGAALPDGDPSREYVHF
jgi:hypothetical protein